MLTRGAITDLIMEHLRPSPAARPAAPKKVPELRKRTFLSDWELRRLYKPGAREVRVPAAAILSPLSLDWLEYEGIRVVRE